MGEAASVVVVSDGEAQRDNMIDYFTERMPGGRSIRSELRWHTYWIQSSAAR